MVDKVKTIVSDIIEIPEGRISFLKAVPSYRTDKFGREITVDPKTGKPAKKRYSMTWLLDPSNPVIQPVIAKIKSEALRILDLKFGGREGWPKDNPTTGTKGVLFCFGDANKLPKVYDGYKDMFYVKVSDTIRPIFGTRRGQSLIFDENDGQWHILGANGVVTPETVGPDEAPFGGAWGRGRIALYVYNNEQAGVNANFHSVQMLRPDQRFGGGGSRNAAEELAQMSGDAAPKAAAVSAPDPWD